MRNPFEDMIVMFLLIVFLIMITYIASFAYEKKYYPITLSKFQYSTYKTHQDLPEDIDSITYAANLNQCPQGQCAIDKSTGFKRCPEKVTNRLVYNKQEEACTRVNFCDYEPFPYAVRTDGSAFSNICENNPDGEKVPCRCTNKQKCSENELVKFSILGGNPDNVSSENFAIIQSDFADQSKIGYYNIPIGDTSTDFCKINPGFTDLLIGGCDFENSIQERLGCKFITSVVADSAKTEPSSWVLNKDITPGDNMIFLQVTESQTQNIFLPSQGILILTQATENSNTQGKVETIKYSDLEFNPSGATGVLDNKTVELKNVINLSLFIPGTNGNQSIPGSDGFQTDWELSKTIISVGDIDVSNCLTSNTEPNYKNMLLCTQSDNNVCKYGTFSYNFDKLRNVTDKQINVTNETFSRNFCQLNVNKDPNVIELNYLEDPTFYTLSCSIGSGCDGKSFQLPDVQGDNVKTINSHAAGKYFPEVDINGINGVWGVSTNQFPLLILDDSKQLLNNDTVQAGDFWSIKFINQTLISGDKVTASGGSSIIVQDLFGLSEYINITIPDNDSLAPGLCIGTKPYRLTAANYTIEDGVNVSGISITPSLSADLPAFSPIIVRPPNNLQDYTYGIIAKDTTQSSGHPYVLKTLDGIDIPPEKFQGIEVHLVIYKQFSFSGGNYVTKVTNGSTTSLKSFNRRLYMNGSNKPYELNAIVDGSQTQKLTYPFPPQNISQLDLTLFTYFDENTAFYSPESPFKIPMSMYYPVWNPVLFQQECVRCKPSLISYPQLTEEGKISNVIIQFCGKDFGNYEYNINNNTFCYVSTSNLDFDNPEKTEITSQRLVLKEPNTNVMVGDYVLDCGLQLPYNVVPSSSTIDNTVTYSYLKILPQIFPSSKSITDYKNVFQEIHDGEFPISFGSEESTSENFSFNNQKLYPSNGVSVIYNTKSSSWEATVNKDYNYFFGKKYQSSDEYNSKMVSGNNGVYTEGFYFVPLQKVTNISEDKRVFILDSPYPYKINQINNHETHVQFCRLDSSLGLCVASAGGQIYPNTIFSVDSLSDSRITNIRIDKNEDNFVLENPPLISIETKNQNFI